jgi:hypothetical protein
MAELAKSVINSDFLSASQSPSREFSLMAWRLFADSDAEWDRAIAQLHNSSPYQTSSWARFREPEGWSSIRMVTADHAGLVQFLYRSKWGLRVAWAPGGPLGDISTEALDDLLVYLRQQIPGVLAYARIADFAAHTPSRHDRYLHSGWQRPRRRLSSGQTLTRSLVINMDTFRDTYTKNWTRNLRRGEERGISASVWNSPLPAEIARLHAYVAETKGISTSDWRIKPLRLKHLLECFQNQLIIVRAVDSNGITHAVRGAVICGDTGFDFLAATSSDGRKTYASNVALDHLLEVLARRGVVTYDFGGVDPTNNKGVYDFKHGAGGQKLSYVGEFETSHPRSIRQTLSTLIALRMPI